MIFMKYAYKNQESRKFVKKISTRRETLKNYNPSDILNIIFI